MDLRAHDLKAASPAVWQDVENLRTACKEARQLLACLTDERAALEGGDDLVIAYKRDCTRRAEMDLRLALAKAHMAATGDAS